MERYSRQILFEGIGEEGQRRLRAARVLLVGCGALGSAQAEMLARAGVGELRIVDRDFVEESNLQRQTLFAESDAERLVAGCDLVLDGTDNFATRFLVNDACVKRGVNWVYGAAVGSYGVTLTVRPGTTPCLRCVFPEVPAAGTAPTCDTAGVIMPVISVVAAVQVTEALKLLTGRVESLHGRLMQFDVWRNEWRQINAGGRAPDCPSCGLRRFETLEAGAGGLTTVLCG